MPQSELKLAKAGMRDVYERQAAYWDRVRTDTLYEKPWLDRFRANLPAGAKILDLGCGSGYPVAGYFLELGYDVTGVDYAMNMIALAEKRYPSAKWHHQDMSALDLSQGFDGIYSWDGFFHLSIEEQRQLLPSLTARIHSGGALLLTVGHGEGEVGGMVGDEPVYHASLSEAEYRDILAPAGFTGVTLVVEDEETRGRSVLLATGKEGVVSDR